MLRRRLVHIGLAAAALSGIPASAQTIPPLRPGFDTITLDTTTLEPPVNTATIPLPAEEPVTIRKPRNAVADPYAALGLKLGPIVLYPSVNIAAVYTSNVAKAATDTEDDWGLRLRPAFRLESDWPRHAWDAGGSGDLVWYEDRDDLDSHQADIFSRFRLDIRRTTRAEFDASYNLDQTGIEDSEVPDTAIGNRTEHEFAAAMALVHDFGPFEARLKAGASWLIFEDLKLAGGGVENNADRDYVEPVLSLRAAFTDPPSFKPFVEAAYTPRLHDKTIDRNGLRRDSQGWSAGLGVMIERGPFWSGEVALVYLVRDYEDPALETNDTAGLNANLIWSPTELTSIAYSASTELGETVSATSSGSRTWTFGAQLRHGLRENVDLLAGIVAEFEEFPDGTDLTLDANLGFEWTLNPSLVLTSFYDGTWLDATTNNRDYEEHRVSVGVTLRR